MPAFPQTAHVDPNEIRTYELIPAGWYAAQMVDSTSKSAKSGNGEYLALEFDLLDAPYAGRKLWVNLNLWNANEEAVRIANQQRLELLDAMGRPTAQTTEELYGIPVMLKVAVKEDRSGQYETRNEVKGFKAYGQRPGVAPGRPAAPQAPRAPAPATPAPARAAAPWQRST